jgi:hypothetical protein
MQLNSLNKLDYNNDGKSDDDDDDGKSDDDEDDDGKSNDDDDNGKIFKLLLLLFEDDVMVDIDVEKFIPSSKGGVLMVRCLSRIAERVTITYMFIE